MKPIQQHSPGPAMGRPPGAPRGLSTPGCLVGAAFLVPLLALPAPGDVVVLRNGAAIEGRIALETDQLVLVEVDGGGRIRIDKRKVAEVVRDREPAAAERAARPARDLLVLKNGATVEGEIILETPRVVAIKIGRSGTVQYDKRTLKHVIRAERPAAAKPEPGRATGDPTAATHQRSASPGERPAVSSPVRRPAAAAVPGSGPTNPRMLEVLAGLLGDTRAAGSRQDSTLSAEDLRSAVEAARVAFEAQGRLLEALERLEARKPGPRVSEASSPAKLGDHQASLLLELLLRAVKDPRSEALLRVLGESEPERPGRPRGGARD